MDDIARWVNLSFVFAGLILWWLCARIVETFFGWFEIADTHVIGENLTMVSMYGLIGSVIITTVLWRHQKLYAGGLNVARELKKVTWPTLEETKSATRVVIVTTLIIAGILATFDFTFQRLTALILGVDS